MGLPLLFGLGGAYTAGQYGLFDKAADFYKNQLVPSIDEQLQQSGGVIPGGPTFAPTLTNPNAVPESVRFTGNRNDPITMVNADGTVGTIPATGPITSNPGSITGTNGISAADLIALAKNAQTNPILPNSNRTEEIKTGLKNKIEDARRRGQEAIAMGDIGLYEQTQKQIVALEDALAKAPGDIASMEMPTHTMPDGTVHPGATHADYMLMQNDAGMTRGLKGYNQIDPIMKQDADTDRKRDRTSFGEMLMDRLNQAGSGTEKLMNRMNQAEPGMLTPAEKMIRTGSAIVGAADQGGLAAMQAAGNTYGAIQDYERLQEQQQIDNYINSLTSSGQLTGQQQIDLQREVTAMETQLGIMDNSLAALRSDSDLTGPFSGNILRFWDRASNSDKSAFREKIRLGLEKLRVDGILENTKNTKGAISDKEMALFMAPTPSLSAQEGVWIAWIEERQRVLRDVIYRMQNNIRIDPASEVGNPIVISSGATSAPTTNTAPQYSQEDMDTLNKYGLGQ